MLEVWRCQNPEQKQELFDRANTQTDSWIVSDLQSKWHLQRKWLDCDGVLDQTAVLRAGELWRRFAFQLRPDLQILSAELAQSLIWNWLEPKGLPWARTPLAVSVVQKQMQMWVSVLSASDYKSVMSEWFANHTTAIERWGHWFMLCSELWEWFQERGLILAPWLPGFLLNEDLDRITWPRRLRFDLGPQISLVEGQLIRELGRRQDVAVLYPEAPWSALMPETLRAYEPILGETIQGDPTWQPELNDRLRFGRFSTQLAEVKDAVARVRRWLDAGVSAESVAVVAPDIEELWPSLRLYFEREGVPVHKPVTAKLGSFPEMSRWLGTLRTRVRKAKTADLEMMAFTANDQPALPVVEFRRLFSRIYDGRDLQRAEKIFGGAPEKDLAEACTLAEFLAWALMGWPDAGDVSRLEALLASATEEAPAGLVLPMGEWISYIEGLLARREMTLAPAADGGVWCISLSSAHWLPLTHAVFINLNEGSLRSLDSSPVTASEAQTIFQDTGFALGPMERQQLEFELIWFLQKPWAELRLTFSTTDFEGQVLTPSRLWMWAAFVNGKFIKEAEAPLVTRWDEIQRQSKEKLASNETLTGLKRDAGEVETDFGKAETVSFSASGLERFWDCPFLFGIEKRWRLRDEAALDLDLDRASRGKLLHALLDRLTVEPLRFDWSDIELQTLVDELRGLDKIEVVDERLWPAIRQQHVRLCRSFLNFEKEWRSRFPKTRTVGREVEIKGFWDVAKGEPVKESTEFSFSGRIDRVDADSLGHYALIDYKSSAAKVSSWRSWLKNFSIQLPFYSLLLENGFTPIPDGNVTAANYFVVKDSDRKRGFHLKDDASELYPPDLHHAYVITEDQKLQMYLEMKGAITAALKEIQHGRLSPQPRDFSQCGRCSWSKQCRAPHLN